MASAQASQSNRDLSSEAYRQLKESIQKGTLVAGQRVIEKELTERLAMSRTPVREALQRLTSEGLLSYEPRRGLTVTQPDHQMVMELYEMREVLEARAASLAARHASDIEINSLGELIKEEELCLDDAQALSQINERFHGLMHLAAHNRYLLKSLRSMSDTLCLLPTMLGNSQRAHEAHIEHSAIIEAIARRDPVASMQAMQAHMQSAQRSRLRWLVESGMLEKTDSEQA